MPEDALREVADFVEYRRYKRERRSEEGSVAPRAVALGGLWAGVRISDEDIAEVRREMWENFGDRGF